MKWLLLYVRVLCQLEAGAESPVVLTIDTNARGAAIPRDFAGLSFETANLLPDTNGHHLFSAENQPLVNLLPGHWTALPISADGQCVLTVNSASAAIVHLMKPGSP